MNEFVKIFLIGSDDEGGAVIDEGRVVRTLGEAWPDEVFQVRRLTDPSQPTPDTPHLLLLRQARSAPFDEQVASLGRRWPDVPIVGLLTDRTGVRSEREPLVPAGLSDFIRTPADDWELAVRITRLLKEAQGAVWRDVRETCSVQIESLVGASAIFQSQVDKIPLFADVDATVLLQGETGTSKEVFARAIHYHSARKDKAFIPINCAALPDQLFENELFGHMKGAYTNAAAEQNGLVSEAEGGTLFLDEVDALTPYAQAKLLRFVQYREYRPLGCSRARVANVRLLAASNHDLRLAVAQRHFREDLFHRLNVLALVVPPLRDRAEDIPLLARQFLRRHAKAEEKEPRRLSPAAIQKLLAHSWPGNVRELESTLQRALVMTTGPVLQAKDIEFAAESLQPLRLDGSLRAAKTSAAMDVERAYLVKTLATFRGNVTHAAKAAGKERRSFQRLLRKYGIDRQLFQGESAEIL